MARRRLPRRTVLLLLALAGALGSAYAGARFGSRFSLNKLYIGAPTTELVRLSLREAFGLTSTYSQFSQDAWVLHTVYPGVTDGYFVDIGSGDGVLHSNTKRLEERGWRGLCIDPFPTNMSSRTCQMLEQVVYSSAGQEMEFRRAGLLGGIDQHMGSWKDEVKDAPLVKFRTTTLDAILDQHQAPPFVHYVSLDVEGAELEVLRGWTPNRHRVGAFTIEHNFQEPKRTEILRFLEERGYRRVRSVGPDDWYVSKDQAASRIPYAAVYRYVGRLIE